MDRAVEACRDQRQQRDATAPRAGETEDGDGAIQAGVSWSHDEAQLKMTDVHTCYCGNAGPDGFGAVVNLRLRLSSRQKQSERESPSVAADSL